MFPRDTFVFEAERFAFRIFLRRVWWRHKSKVNVHRLKGLGFVVGGGNMAARDVIDERAVGRDF